MYKQLLQTFGFDLVMQNNENQRRKRHEEREMVRVPNPPPPPPEEKPPDGETKSTCQHCNKEFPSVFALKTHCEAVLKDKVPLEFRELFAEQFKSTYERKSGAPNSSRAASPAPQGERSPSLRGDNSGNFNENGNAQGDAQAGTLLAAQVQEMQAALNMIQLQQQLGQLHPMVAQMLSLGLPPGLNVGALAANLQTPLVPLMLPPPPLDKMPYAHDAQMKQQQLSQQQKQANAAAGQKRARSGSARTRITDEQLKILREHFDIDNSPSNEAIAKIAQQSGLATKVIKYWFRNTLFKERQRNKDSPYNFNNPPSTSLNLEEYERTGEAKVTTLDSSASSDEAPPEKKVEDVSMIPPKVKSQPSDEPSMHEKYHTYDDRHQEDKSFIFPQAPPQSLAPIIHTNDHLHQNKSRPQTPTHIPLNSLIQSQLGSIPSTSIPQPPHPSMLPPKMNTNFTSPNSAPPNVLPLTPNRSLGPGWGPADFGLSGGNWNGSNSSTGSSGERANRTRFTDYQIKVLLQGFFEFNAYPKDDDLEYLSKLLGLSPRVIVVWFQNARQKQQKSMKN